MNSDDELIVRSGKSLGLTLTYSNNVGGWSAGTPYELDDIEWNPLRNEKDAFQLMVMLHIYDGLNHLTTKDQVMREITRQACLFPDHSKSKSTAKGEE